MNRRECYTTLLFNLLILDIIFIILYLINFNFIFLIIECFILILTFYFFIKCNNIDDIDDDYYNSEIYHMIV